MFHPKGPTFWELAVQALSSTERGYDLLAPKFDYTPFRTPDSILDRAGEYLKTIGPCKTGLDLCCGTGAAMRILQPVCGERVVGIDLSAGMLAEARRRLTAPSPPTPLPRRGEGSNAALEFVRGNVLALPFSGAFDVAVCFGAFGHILKKDEPRFVAQIARVLRPGGRFVFVTSYLPALWSPGYWLACGFNAAMRVRNFLVAPPFIMYYLTFLLPGAQDLLQANGFEVAVTEVRFDWPFAGLRLVVATLRSA